MSRWFRRHVLSRLWLTFVVLGLAFFVFGACTVDLGLLFTANLRLLAEHGWMAAMDGAAVQLLQLAGTGYLGVAAYVVLKTCEHRLSDWLGHTVHGIHHGPAAPPEPPDRSPPRQPPRGDHGDPADSARP
jgi:hypothetical protein